jgi:hypothetical protein
MSEGLQQVIRGAVIMLRYIEPGAEMTDEDFLLYVEEKIVPEYHEEALVVARELLEEDNDED